MICFPRAAALLIHFSNFFVRTKKNDGAAKGIIFHPVFAKSDASNFNSKTKKSRYFGEIYPPNWKQKTQSHRKKNQAERATYLQVRHGILLEVRGHASEVEEGPDLDVGRLAVAPALGLEVAVHVELAVDPAALEADRVPVAVVEALAAGVQVD